MRVEGAVLYSGLLFYVMRWLYVCHFEDGVNSKHDAYYRYAAASPNIQMIKFLNS